PACIVSQCGRCTRTGCGPVCTCNRRRCVRYSFRRAWNIEDGKPLYGVTHGLHEMNTENKMLPRLTIICPVYNEEKVVPLFFERALPVIKELSTRYQVDLLFLNNA